MQDMASVRRADRRFALLGVTVLVLMFQVWRLDHRDDSPLVPPATTALAPPAPVPPGAPTIDPARETPNDPIWRQTWIAIDNPDRDHNPVTRLVLDRVDARPGMVIADVGAGGGYFAARFSPLVGPTGRVLAVDADPRMVRKVAYERSVRGLQNIIPIGVIYGNLGLAPASVDVITFIEVGAFLSCEPARNREYLQQAAGALRSGGRLLVVNDSAERRAASGGTVGCHILSLEALIDAAAPEFTALQREEILLPSGWRGYAALFQKR
jgi:precorrin-6B methylase 2